MKETLKTRGTPLCVERMIMPAFSTSEPPSHPLKSPLKNQKMSATMEKRGVVGKKVLCWRGPVLDRHVGVSQ